MQTVAYKTTDIDKFIVVEVPSYESKTYSKQEILENLNSLETQFSEIPTDPTDNELLEWAKVHFPRTDYSEHRRFIQEQIDKNQAVLQVINNALSVSVNK
jgi:hypothetical protein